MSSSNLSTLSKVVQHTLLVLHGTTEKPMQVTKFLMTSRDSLRSLRRNGDNSLLRSQTQYGKLRKSLRGRSDGQVSVCVSKIKRWRGRCICVIESKDVCAFRFNATVAQLHMNDRINSFLTTYNVVQKCTEPITNKSVSMSKATS
jgi:hypothetical protein